MPEHSQELNQLIRVLYPNFNISGVPKESGQRVVFFGAFTEVAECEPEQCNTWGDVVLKICDVTSRTTMSYIQKEVEVLSQIDSKFFPKLFFNEAITIHPETEEPLVPIKLITIEEKIIAQPLSNLMGNYRNEETVILFLEQIVEAMNSLWNHPQKLVHRDLKPDNILIRDDGSLAIIDLGLLRQEGSIGVTNSFFDIGPCTPAYASPEQAKNQKRDISFKSDLFSIGIICYEMLSGKNPFIDNDSENYRDDILERVCEFNPPSLENIGINNYLSKLIEKMMNKELYKRYRSPEILLSDLKTIKESL